MSDINEYVSIVYDVLVHNRFVLPEEIGCVEQREYMIQSPNMRITDESLAMINDVFSLHGVNIIREHHHQQMVLDFAMILLYRRIASPIVIVGLIKSILETNHDDGYGYTSFFRAVYVNLNVLQYDTFQSFHLYEFITKYLTINFNIDPRERASKMEVIISLLDDVIAHVPTDELSRIYELLCVHTCHAGIVLPHRIRWVHDRLRVRIK